MDKAICQHCRQTVYHTPVYDGRKGYKGQIHRYEWQMVEYDLQEAVKRKQWGVGKSHCGLWMDKKLHEPNAMERYVNGEA